MDSGGLHIETKSWISGSQMLISCMLTHAKHASAKGENQCSEEGDVIHGNILSTSLAVMCTRRFVTSAHATKPGIASQLLNFVAFRVIQFWFLDEHT